MYITRFLVILVNLNVATHRPLLILKTSSIHLLQETFGGQVEKSTTEKSPALLLTSITHHIFKELTNQLEVTTQRVFSWPHFVIHK